MAVLSALTLDTPRPLRLINPDVSPALEALVMRLLAKDPAERPASAQEVVEAIKAIERELLAERPKAEPSEVTPRTEELEALKQLKFEIAEGPDEPSTGALTRPGHRTQWIAGTVLVTVATISGLLLIAPDKISHRIVAHSPASVWDFTERAVAEPAATKPNDAKPSQPEAGQGQPRPDEAQGIVPRKSSLTPSTETREIAPVGPDQLPLGQEMVHLLPEARPKAPDTAPKVKAGDQRPGPARPEPKELPGVPTKVARTRDNWGEPVIPDGDCKVELDRPGNLIRFVVPGTPHVLSAELGRLNAPRILQEVRGDFDARVRVVDGFHPAGKTTQKEYAPYHGAGLLLWQDEDNYVRLELAADLQHGKVRPYINFEYRKDGALADSKGQRVGDGSNYLRLRRRGDEILGAFGPDGAHWTSFAPFSAKLKDRLNIGVAAINTAAKPLTGELYGFEVTEVAEDTGDPNAGTVNPSGPIDERPPSSQ